MSPAIGFHPLSHLCIHHPSFTWHRMAWHRTASTLGGYGVCHHSSSMRLLLHSKTSRRQLCARTHATQPQPQPRSRYLGGTHQALALQSMESSRSKGRDLGPLPRQLHWLTSEDPSVPAWPVTYGWLHRDRTAGGQAIWSRTWKPPDAPRPRSRRNKISLTIFDQANPPYEPQHARR